VLVLSFALAGPELYFNVGHRTTLIVPTSSLAVLAGVALVAVVLAWIAFGGLGSRRRL
jgi:hypothetical protein